MAPLRDGGRGSAARPAPTPVAMSGAVRGAHFFRKLPRELTEATQLGGIVSLVGIATAILLTYANTVAYLTTSKHTKLVLDLQTDEYIDLIFNVTLERLPCRFTSLDLFDETGTKRLNVSGSDIVKQRVSSETGEHLGPDESEVWEDLEHDDAEDAADENTGARKGDVPQLDADGLAALLQKTTLTVVAYGAPWCPWSRRLEPVWQSLYQSMEPELWEIGIARVDCTANQELCSEQHVSAFPTVRVYREHNIHSHENYHGDRTVDSLKAFIVEAHHSSDNYEFHPLTHLTHTSGEGCMVHGRVTVSRVPGSMRLSAQSLFHSFDPLGMNVTHHVDAMLFAAPGAECPHLKAVTQAEQVWANDEQFSCAYRRAMNALIDHRDALARGAERAPVGEATLLSSRFVMHEQAMTLKHYLKVVPTRRVTLRGDESDSYEYSTNFNEFRNLHDRPNADDEIHRLVPNTVFAYTVSPYRVVHRETAQSFGSYLTQLCAVVGGVFTVFGLVDGALYNGIKAVKQD